MARNVELKVGCDTETLSDVRRRLAREGHDVVELHHRDTYLRPARGRLKIREIRSAEGASAELIAYSRPDEPGTRLSVYERAPISTAELPGLLSTLRAALGELVVVEKRRLVAVVGRTRVHLDEVAGLGCFVELETVLDDDDGAGEGRQELAEVAALLGIAGLPPLSGSYGELMLAAGEGTGGGR